MGVDALGQLQFVPAGLLKGGDDMVVDLEMACADVIDQLFAKTLQFDVTWEGALLALGGHEACQPHVLDQQRLSGIQPVIYCSVLACQCALGFFQFS